MRKTVLIVTEQRSSATEREAREIVQQRVALWLKGALLEANHHPLQPRP